MKYLLFFSFFIPSVVTAQLPPIGQWREHLNYQSAIQIVKGDKIYCATSNALFSVEANEIERYSKVTGLAETGVSCIAWDETTQQLVVAYNNSNLDILKGSIVKNIGDIVRSTLAGNKTINSINCNAGFAYLSVGLGIIVVDLVKYEIKDTWFIGTNGNQIIVNAVTSDANNFYAATAEGLKQAPISSDLSNYNNWQIIGNNNIAQSVVNCNNNAIIVQKNDSLFQLSNNNYSFVYADASWQMSAINFSQNKILVCEKNSNGNAKLVQITIAGIVEKTFISSSTIITPKAAMLDNTDVWIADSIAGLSKNTTETYIPNGPLGTADGQMIFANNNLYVAAGSINDNWNYQHNKNGVYTFSNDVWSDKGYYNSPILDTVLDFICLANNKKDNTIWAGAYIGGLIAFNNDSITIYKKENSTLQGTVGDENVVRISGLAFDQNNNLWIGNYGAPNILHGKKNDNSFKAFTVPFTLNENAIGQILCDDNNNIWMLSPQGNGLICFNYGNSVDDLSDDKWRYFQAGSQQGNLPSSVVVCLAKDANNVIWLGTTNGIAIFTCTDNPFDPNCQATLPVVKEGQFAGYLFQNERVQSIAVDAANRKWVASKNGVWLTSADGDKIIERFTVDNSPLLSNNVKQIAINPQNGEVFFATAKGICSYRGTAVDATTSNSNVLIFPNPVPPNYAGTIAIKGVPDNSVVKITELNGRLVYQTRSLGGQAVWNGLNYKNEKIAGGVYLVFATNDDGSETLVTKIVMVR